MAHYIQTLHPAADRPFRGIKPDAHVGVIEDVVESLAALLFDDRVFSEDHDGAAGTGEVEDAPDLAILPRFVRIDKEKGAGALPGPAR